MRGGHLLHLDDDIHLPRGRELDAVGEEVEEDLAEPVRVAYDARLRCGVEVAADLQPLGHGAPGDRVDGVLQRRAQVELDADELQLARLDLGEVEDVVDEHEERLGRSLDLLRELLLLVCEERVHDELVHPHDHVERRPHLVRHGCEELRLGVVGGLRLEQQRLLLHQAPHLRDVLAHADDPYNLARHIPSRRGVEQHFHSALVLGEERELEVRLFDALQRVIEHLSDRGAEFFGDVYLHQVLAHNLMLGEARNLCRLVVPLVHQPVRVDPEDGRVRRVDERLQLLRDSRLLDLDLLALRDVLADTQHAHHIAADVAPGRGVEQHLDSALVLGVEGKLEVGGFSPLEGVVEHLLHTFLVFFCDEVLCIGKRKHFSE